MRDEKKITQADIDAAEVRLGPIAGIPTRVWLPAAWLTVLLAILFALLVLPGILKPGSRLRFTGTPSDAAVWVDGSYRGTARSGVFVAPGDHEVTLSRPGFSPGTQKVKTGTRMVGSLFIPARRTIAFTLLPADAPAELHRALGEFSRWANTGKPTSVWQIPSVLSESLLAFGEAGAFAAPGAFAAAPEASAAAIARAALSISTSPQTLRDGLRATFIASGAGTASPLGMAAGLRALLGSAPSGGTGPAVTAAWLTDLVAPSSGKVRGALSKSGGSPSASSGAEARPSPAQASRAPAPKAVGTESVAGLPFVRFSAGTLRLQGLSPAESALPYDRDLESFALAATETTVGQWAAFLAENPRWRPDNRDALIADGLADAAYLADWNPRADARLPVTGVSWHAAAAYCEWLSRKAGPGTLAVLPSEAMWEAALQAGGARDTAPDSAPAVWARADRTAPERAGSRGAAGTGISDLLGNVWEWTSDGYLAYPAFAPEGLPVPEKTVRGGSWANSATAMQAGSRGGTEAAHASAFLGFRPALVRR